MTIFTKLFSSQGRDIIEEGTSNGFQYAIVEGPYYYCAYVALPEGHKYYDVFYDNIPIECNGGLTFSGKYDNFYLIGWDYGHSWNMEQPPFITEMCSDVLSVTEQLLQ